MGRFKRLRRTVRYSLLRAVLWPLEIIPRAVALPLGRLLGDAVWRLQPGARARIRENMLRSTPVVPADGGTLGRQRLRALGSNAVDFLRLHRYDRLRLERIVRVDGEEHLLRGLAGGRGVVVATGHVGNWELLAAYCARRGFPVHVITRPIRDARFDRFVEGRRRDGGMRPIGRRNGLVGAAMVLRGGGRRDSLRSEYPRGVDSTEARGMGLVP